MNKNKVLEPFSPDSVSGKTGNGVVFESPLLLTGWQWAVLVFVGYLLCAEISALLLPRPYVFTVLWLPSGFYLGCLLLASRTKWAWIIFAACCANIIFDEQLLHSLKNAKPILTSLGFCVSNTAEAVLGASLMRRFISPRPTLRSTREVVGFAGFCAMLSPAVGAFIGGTIAYHTFGGNYWQILGMWWSGDMVSVFSITPLFLTARTIPGKPRHLSNTLHNLEFLLITCLMLILTAVVFSEDGRGFPHKYVTIPLLLVVAMRFGPLGTALSCVLMAATAGWCTPHLSGQFFSLPVSRVCSLIIEVQSFLGVMALTALVVAAVLEERKDAEEKIKRWNAELEVRVKERTAQLEMTNRELETFSYSVSHDLRAPLRSIGGFTQALREDADRHLSLQGRHYLDEVQSATHRMAQLIDDLLKLSRLQRSELKRNRVDISATVQHLCDTLQAQHPHRQIEWIIAPEVQANADGRLLENALENLLNNAVKFTAKHAHARIEFGVSKREEQVVYYVRDDGAGFNMNYVAKLFIPFQRLHLADEFEGNGVGLATVQRIVQRHGGNIWAEGAVEQGATFFFTLDGEK